MGILEFVTGIVIGGAMGYISKAKLSKKNQQCEIDKLCVENEKLRKQITFLKRQIEDFEAQMTKVRREAKESVLSNDELEDDLLNAKKENKNLRLQNDTLAKRLLEYKNACESLEGQIKLMKLKYDNDE